MRWIAWFAALVFALGCRKPADAPGAEPAPSASVDSGKEEAPSSSVAPVDAGKKEAPIGWAAFGAGPTHASVEVGAVRGEDNPGVRALGVGFSGALAQCYKGATGATHLTLHVTIGTAGPVTDVASDDLRVSEYRADASSKDAEILRCIDKAVKATTFPASLQGTSFDVKITLKP